MRILQCPFALFWRGVFGPDRISALARFGCQEKTASEAMQNTPARGADMVLMRMGDDERVDPAQHRIRNGRVIAGAAAGIDAAVEQDRVAPMFNRERGPSLLAKTAM